jgi:hypothetical protein
LNLYKRIHILILYYFINLWWIYKVLKIEVFGVKGWPKRGGGPKVRGLTYIFACAAAILLEVLVSGAIPQIQEYASRIITTLTGLPNYRLLLSLSWPLCINACMAKPIHYQF